MAHAPPYRRLRRLGRELSGDAGDDRRFIRRSRCSIMIYNDLQAPSAGRSPANWRSRLAGRADPSPMPEQSDANHPVVVVTHDDGLLDQPMYKWCDCCWDQGRRNTTAWARNPGPRRQSLAAASWVTFWIMTKIMPQACSARSSSCCACSEAAVTRQQLQAKADEVAYRQGSVASWASRHLRRAGVALLTARWC